MTTPLPLSTRLALAWRVLFDGEFAARAREASTPGEPPALEPAPTRPGPAGPSATDGALQLLAILQREGRLIDFVQQDITSFSDGDVGAAARVVHEGCRKAIRSHGSVSSVRSENEGAKITVEAGDVGRVKLTGNVSGSAPYHGVLRHRGWRVEKFSLPTLVGEQDLCLVAPAEVEL